MVKKLTIWALLLIMLAAAVPAQAVSQMKVTWEGAAVELKTIGSWQTVVRAGGKDVTVQSSELSWESATDTRFAYIYAPNAGRANRRMSPRAKASIIDKIPTGRIVLVFEKDDSWSGIYYDGLVGYVQNSTLRFVEDPEKPRATATLSYKGDTHVTTKVTMRSAASQSSKSVVGLKPGMPVVIFDLGKTWSEVEVNGYHGFVLTVHLADIVEADASAADAGDKPGSPETDPISSMPAPPDDGIPLVEEEVELD